MPWKLKQIMAEKDIRPVTLSVMTGLKQSRISKWLSGKETPTLRDMVTIGMAIGADFNYLLRDELDAPASLTEDEQRVLNFIRRKGWSYDDMVDRLTSVGPADPPRAGQPSREVVIPTDPVTGEDVPPGTRQRRSG